MLLLCFAFLFIFISGKGKHFCYEKNNAVGVINLSKHNERVEP